MEENTYWVLLDNYGFIEQAMITALPPPNFIPVPENLVENISELFDTPYYKVNDAWNHVDKKPGNFYVLNKQLKIWEFSLTDAKLSKWNELKQIRKQKLEQPLTTPYGTFDVDQRSQKNITDAVALLQTLEAQQPNQTIEFTLYDNTTVTLTTQEMINVGILLGQRTQQIYATSRQLREQLDLAQTKQEVEAISWPQ